jgi:hypothetical protein
MSGFVRITQITRSEIKKEDVNRVQAIGELITTDTVTVDMTNERPVDLFTINGSALEFTAIVNNPTPTSPITKEIWIYPAIEISTITFGALTIVTVGDMPTNLQAGKTHVFVCRQMPTNNDQIIMNYSYSF